MSVGDGSTFDLMCQADYAERHWAEGVLTVEGMSHAMCSVHAKEAVEGWIKNVGLVGKWVLLGSSEYDEMFPAGFTEPFDMEIVDRAVREVGNPLDWVKVNERIGELEMEQSKSKEKDLDNG